MAFDPKRPILRNRNLDQTYPPWAWVTGVVVVFVLGVLVWTAMDKSTVKSTDRSPASQSSTTGAGPGTPPPAAPGRETKGSAR